MNTDELIEAIRIPGSYVLDSLPDGKYILTPIEPGEIKNTETSHEECKSFFQQGRS
ncbi:MAG: hypothetical protein E6Y55_24820 [Klebsiella michiganensis]|uniref:Uncharacterized protein n=2 Tax=Klebsiella TaxID=570 RepID=A0AAI9DZ22_KLEOX|nr:MULTISPECIES: hypothetical protein [Klebsiella/Raoultella group]DAJ11865.1 MAG TPA: hypothetical protein [Caudoviricetes sp.]HBZ9585038.1 hypothetical protein [Klebsiella pneumoniae]EHT02727.1 hypothetical protein HMPREF9686_00750 [Klebsiella michiganensis]ELM5278942.1 hypothetical protein [Klebsiella oxytoca]EWF84165.1 hypothetical protein L373_04197 [Klebsiella michiganensis]